MIAFKVIVNGETIATIGQDDVSILNTMIVASVGNEDRDIDDYINLRLGGMSHELEGGYCQHFRWKGRNLSVGDVVQIEIVESSVVDPPMKRYRSDNKVQENPYTKEETRQMRYADYLQLKKEFEGDDV